MLGRILISLISTVRCFLRASAAFFCAWYLYLPKSRILHTGGSELGEISTRSSPASTARANASPMGTTPTLVPVASMSWMFGVSMPSLMRGPPLSGVSFIGRLTMSCSPLHERRRRIRGQKAMEPPWFELTNFQCSTGTEMRLTSQAARARAVRDRQRFQGKIGNCRLDGDLVESGGEARAEQLVIDR